MATTASVAYADVLLYKFNIFQSRYFLIKMYDIFKNSIFRCYCWASVNNELLQWFQVHHTFATIQNPAVYISAARVSIFPTLVPRLLTKIKYFINMSNFMILTAILKYAN